LKDKLKNRKNKKKTKNLFYKPKKLYIKINPCQHHVMEFGESDGLGGIYEESYLYMDRIRRRRKTI